MTSTVDENLGLTKVPKEFQRRYMIKVDPTDDTAWEGSWKVLHAYRHRRILPEKLQKNYMKSYFDIREYKVGSYRYQASLSRNKQTIIVRQTYGPKNLAEYQPELAQKDAKKHMRDSKGRKRQVCARSCAKMFLGGLLADARIMYFMMNKPQKDELRDVYKIDGYERWEKSIDKLGEYQKMKALEAKELSARLDELEKAAAEMIAREIGEPEEDDDDEY
jgi:hypothetical protein